MTDIEQKALELVNAIRGERGSSAAELMEGANWLNLRAALLASIEAHELDKSRHAAEMREQAERFSEAAGRVREVTEHWTHIPHIQQALDILSPFILAPDPLVEAIDGLWTQDNCKAEHMARGLRAALDARGLAIVKKEAVNG